MIMKLMVLLYVMMQYILAVQGIQNMLCDEKTKYINITTTVNTEQHDPH